MGLYSGGFIFGRIFASEIWGAYFRNFTETNEELAPKSRDILQMFVWWGAVLCPNLSHSNLASLLILRSRFWPTMIFTNWSMQEFKKVLGRVWRDVIISLNYFFGTLAGTDNSMISQLKTIYH